MTIAVAMMTIPRKARRSRGYPNRAWGKSLHYSCMTSLFTAQHTAWQSFQPSDTPTAEILDGTGVNVPRPSSLLYSQAGHKPNMLSSSKASPERWYRDPEDTRSTSICTNSNDPCLFTMNAFISRRSLVSPRPFFVFWCQILAVHVLLPQANWPS